MRYDRTIEFYQDRMPCTICFGTGRITCLSCKGVGWVLQ
jgi:DnaJ-class molecular chaperone